MLFGLISLLYYGITFVISWIFYFIQLTGDKIDFSMSTFGAVLVATAINLLLMLIIFPITTKYQKVISKFTASLENKL